MKGKILDFNTSVSEGIILGDDGKRYSFKTNDFNAEQTPASGLEVDFIASQDNAQDIYITQAPAATGSSANELQNKAAGIAQSITNNEDLKKAKDSIGSNFSRAKVAIVSLSLYAIGSFLIFISISLGPWGGVGWPIIDFPLGKLAFGISILALILIITGVVGINKKMRALIAFSLMLLPFITLLSEVSSLPGANGDIFKALGQNGSFGIGGYLMMVCPWIFLFSPINKKEG